MSLRIIFMGTPEFAVSALKAIAGAGYELCAIYTQPPRPAGRGLDLKDSPVAKIGRHLSVPVYTPASLKQEAVQAEFRQLRADIAVVVAYGLLLPPEILSATRLGCVNIHASLLPRWRGAAPINRAIMANDKQTGVSIIKMDNGLDTGPIYMRAATPILPDMDAGELHDILAKLGANLLIKTLKKLSAGVPAPKPQELVGICYAPKLTTKMRYIDWNSSALELKNQIRGLSPGPGAWCYAPAPMNARQGDKQGGRQRVKILKVEISNLRQLKTPTPGQILSSQLDVACREGSIRIMQLQKAGGVVVDAKTFQNGAKLQRGDLFG